MIRLSQRYLYLLMIGLLPATAYGDGEVSGKWFKKHFDLGHQLLEQSFEQDDGVQLQLEAIEKFKSAAHAKREAAEPWLIIASIYPHIAKSTSEQSHYCDETRDAIKNFFRSCGRCSAPWPGDFVCSPCEYIEKEDGHVAENTSDYASALMERASAVQELKQLLELRVKSLRRCLGTVRFTGNEGFEVQLKEGDKDTIFSLGKTPLEVTLFQGENVLLVSAPGHTTEEKTILVKAGEVNTVDLSLDAKEEKPSKGIEIVAPAPPPDDPLMGWISVGVGTVAVATGAVFLASAITKRDEAESINGQFGRRGEFNALKDDSRSALTVAGITGGLGLITTAAGIWMLVREPEAPEKTSLRLTPGGMIIHGRF